MAISRILVLGKTYPSYSSRYDELSCTGGLLDGTHAMVRLHPINFRDLPVGQRFSAWDWIEADITKDDDDPRPETYRIRQSTIKIVGEVTKAEHKRDHLEQTPNCFGSVEELEEHQKAHKTSLGVIRPATMTGNKVVPRSATELDEWRKKEEAVLRRPGLFDRPKPIDFPDLAFHVGWRCRSTECRTHDMTLHDWGLHELSRKLVDDEERRAKILAKMDEQLDERERDLYLMLGSYRSRMYQFGLMGTLSVKRDAQGSLFRR